MLHRKVANTTGSTAMPRKHHAPKPTRSLADVYDARRENLRELADQIGGKTKLSRLLNYSNASYTSQIIGPHPTRTISERRARHMEQQLHLPPGWLDRESIDQTAILRAVRTALARQDRHPTPEKFAAIVELATDHVRIAGRIDAEHIDRLVRLMF